MAAVIDDQSIEEYLYQKGIAQKIKNLESFLAVGLEKFGDPQEVVAFTALRFEIEEGKTDDIWGRKKFQEIIEVGLKGESINLITMLCCINQFDLAGGYTLAPDLFAYLKNPKLEPVPLIVDELISVVQFFEYYGIKTTLTIYISDTDYTEIGQFGPVNEANLKNLQEYLVNLKNYVAAKRPDVKVLPISSLTDNNSLYQEVKTRVLGNVAAFKNQDFAREWYRKFEDAFERVTESQVKRKLFPKNEIRRKSLEITRKIWAVNAAQGAVFGTLGPNTIVISTERRERDQNYIIDKTSRENFPPVIYILRAAEMWNRKLIGKID